MGVLSKGTDFSNGDQVTDTNLDNLVDNATFTSSAVDDVSTAVGGTGAIIVKDGGITTGKLADSTGAADGVTAAKIATGAVTTAKLAASAVTSSELATNAVTTAKITDSNVTKAKIEDVANMKVLGNTSGSATAPQEVSVLDEDNMSSDSATAIATQQSIKAYVDSAPNFTPSTYAGEESVTLPNGLIMKFGKTSAGVAGTVTVTYGTAFPTAVLSIVMTYVDGDTGASTGDANPHIKTGYSTSSFECYIHPNVSDGTFWQAIGY